MAIEVIENIGINNLHPVFGRGLRGETLAAARNRRFVNDLVAAGVRVVIDLRTADHNDKLMKGCGIQKMFGQRLKALQYRYALTDGTKRGGIYVQGKSVRLNPLQLFGDPPTAS